MKIKFLTVVLALLAFCAATARAAPVEWPKREAMKKKKLVRDLAEEFSKRPFLKENPLNYYEIKGLLADFYYEPPPSKPQTGRKKRLTPEEIKARRKAALERKKALYRRLFLNDEAYADGAVYTFRWMEELKAAEERFGVPKEVIAGIMLVETRFGKHTGGSNALEALYKMYMKNAFREKSGMTRSYRLQIAYLLALCAKKGMDPSEVRGSWAGALGIPQFMPYSYWRYGVDGDGDGEVDLFNSHADAIFSVANYLAAHGWEKNPRRAVLRYNRDRVYARTVLLYAAILKARIWW